MKIRGIQANDLRVLIGRLRQQVLVGANDVRHLHIRAIRVAPWPNDMPFEVDGILVVGRNRKYSDAVPVVNLEGFELLRDFRVRVDFR